MIGWLLGKALGIMIRWLLDNGLARMQEQWYLDNGLGQIIGE